MCRFEGVACDSNAEQKFDTNETFLQKIKAVNGGMFLNCLLSRDLIEGYFVGVREFFDTPGETMSYYFQSVKKIHVDRIRNLPSHIKYSHYTLKLTKPFFSFSHTHTFTNTDV